MSSAVLGSGNRTRQLSPGGVASVTDSILSRFCLQAAAFPHLECGNRRHLESNGCSRFSSAVQETTSAKPYRRYRGKRRGCGPGRYAAQPRRSRADSLPPARRAELRIVSTRVRRIGAPSLNALPRVLAENPARLCSDGRRLT